MSTDNRRTITELASRKARELRVAEGRDEAAVLRIGVQGGGCSGFQYLLEFDERRDDDHVYDLDGLTVVDPFSAPLLSGPSSTTTARSAARASSSRTRRSRPAAAAAAASR